MDGLDDNDVDGANMLIARETTIMSAGAMMPLVILYEGLDVMKLIAGGDGDEGWSAWASDGRVSLRRPGQWGAMIHGRRLFYSNLFLMSLLCFLIRRNIEWHV